MIKFLQAAADTVQVVATELTDVATDAAGTEPQPGAFMQFFQNNSQWILIIAMIVIFYFFMIRPQQKARKKEQEMRDSLKAGDKIMTIGGIHGVIKKVEEDSFLIEVDSNVTLRLAKQAVTPVQQISK